MIKNYSFLTAKNGTQSYLLRVKGVCNILFYRLQKLLLVHHHLIRFIIALVVDSGIYQSIC